MARKTQTKRRLRTVMDRRSLRQVADIIPHASNLVVHAILTKPRAARHALALIAGRSRRNNRLPRARASGQRPISCAWIGPNTYLTYAGTGTVAMYVVGQ